MRILRRNVKSSERCGPRTNLFLLNFTWPRAGEYRYRRHEGPVFEISESGGFRLSPKTLESVGSLFRLEGMVEGYSKISTTLRIVTRIKEMCFQ